MSVSLQVFAVNGALTKTHHVNCKTSTTQAISTFIKSGLATIAATFVITIAADANAASILLINGNGSSSAAPHLSTDFSIISERFRPGAIADHLSVPNDIEQIWIWNDGSFGTTGISAQATRSFSTADEEALISFNADHSHWIMDGLAWRRHRNADEQNFTKNLALNLSSAGGGIVLGADDASGGAIVQHVNQVATLFDFDPFAGIYGTSPSSQQTGGTFFTTPNVVDPTGLVGTTTYAEVPHGLQPNGLFLGTAVFGQGTPLPQYGESPPLDSEIFDGTMFDSVNHLVTTTISGASIDPNPTSTPEPSTLLGLGTLALAGGALLRRKRKA